MVHAPAVVVHNGPVSNAIRWLTGLVLSAVVLIPIVGNQQAVQNVDPLFMRNLVERTVAYGGTFYQNGIHNKGPLEPLVLLVARYLGGYDGVWFVMSLFAAAIAALLGHAASRTVHFTGGHRLIGLGVGVAVFVLFAMGEPQYARVIYVRNLTVGLLALAWIVVLSERAWSTPDRVSRAAGAIGVLLGLAVQTLLTTAFAAAAVGLTAAGLLWYRKGFSELRRAGITAVIAGAVSFFSAPVWYGLRGSFSEFWAGWWVHARFMSVGTGRSLPTQMILGIKQMEEYYSTRPLVLGMLLFFITMTWLRWDSLKVEERLVFLGLVAWFIGSWIELILSQRYADQYFSVLVFPTALMGAVLAGQAWEVVELHRPRLRPLAVPLLVAVLAVAMTSPTNFLEQSKLTSEFTSLAASAANATKGEGGGGRSVRAVLDLVSRRGDPLLAWTNVPEVYASFGRVPATRFQWKSFLLGEIYLGQTSERYVLPETWKWFAEDVAQTQPLAFIETADFVSGSPFESLIRIEFTRVFPNAAGNVWLRNDVAESVLDAQTDRNWSAVSGQTAGTGWTIRGNSAEFQSPGNGSEDVFLLAADSCLTLEGRVASEDSNEGPRFMLRFDNNDDGTDERLFMAIEGREVGSGSAGLGPLGYQRSPLPEGSGSNDGSVEFTLIVGRRSAVLVTGGQIAASLRLPESVRIGVQPSESGVRLSDLRLGQPVSGSGCPRP